MVVINPDNTITYTPNGNSIPANAGHGFYGDDVFAYQISDGSGGYKEANVYVTVEPGDNQAPEANWSATRFLVHLK
jgi:hypothetical protein